MTVVVGQEKKLWKWKCPVANFAYIESLSYNTKEKTIVECSSDNLLKGSEIVALFFFEVGLFLFREWKLNICDEIQNILHVIVIPKVKMNTMLSIYCVILRSITFPTIKAANTGTKTKTPCYSNMPASFCCAEKGLLED